MVERQRLDDVVINAGFDRFKDQFSGGFCRYHDEGDLTERWMFANKLKELKTRDGCHVPIAQDQMKRLRFKRGFRFLSVGGEFDVLEAKGAKQIPELDPDRVHIVNNEDFDVCLFHSLSVLELPEQAT